MARLDDSSIVCDGCGINAGPVPDAVDAEGARMVPAGWRRDSRYEYCPTCGPARIRTMEELEAAGPPPTGHPGYADIGGTHPGGR